MKRERALVGGVGVSRCSEKKSALEWCSLELQQVAAQRGYAEQRAELDDPPRPAQSETLNKKKAGVTARMKSVPQLPLI